MHGAGARHSFTESPAEAQQHPYAGSCRRPSQPSLGETRWKGQCSRTSRGRTRRRRGDARRSGRANDDGYERPRGLWVPAPRPPFATSSWTRVPTPPSTRRGIVSAAAGPIRRHRPTPMSRRPSKVATRCRAKSRRLACPRNRIADRQRGPVQLGDGGRDRLYPWWTRTLGPDPERERLQWNAAHQDAEPGKVWRLQ